MKSSILTALATLLVSSNAYSDDMLFSLKSRPSELGMDILPPKQDPWYSAPANFELAAPGQILRIRAAKGNLTTVQTNSSEAYNILYRTTDSQYKPTWAVTTLLIPNNTVYGSNDKLLSYQIPYDSADVDASPSYAMYAGELSDVGAALGRGWWVSVPDYEGPKASFTAGVMSGHATIDSVRAVLSSGFGLSPNGTKYAMWGYSGGALASEWAAELQVQYASELEFAGAALGGLTPNITSVLTAVSGTVTAGLVPAGILGLASQYPELEQYLLDNLNKEGEFNATGFLEARNYTLVEGIIAFLGNDITDYFMNGTELLTSPIGQKVTNRDGIMGYHGVPQMPIFAYKAIMDEVSPINDTDKLISSYCGIGATIKYERNTVGLHSDESGNGRARALEFLDHVLSGGWNATGCQISNVTVNATAMA
ncbi:related to lipase 1 [Ramularia collo-cygni]|uniref:Related to lipase 1 n=1 Tax=Ramularia collo-cygni TaxID=112498 RepID=A0A2D3VKL7_9PEZI|nr:related to lipase 1 [Ramularia collo-cygni]CZT22934.1 related to lipase 1 [Ramularia collo-cygni]